jgi:T5SS/PEP-CTERM-associated repeat protein
MRLLGTTAITSWVALVASIADSAEIVNGPWAGGTIAPSSQVILADGASLTGVVTVNGTLQFSQAGNLTVPRFISGTGVVLFTHSDTITLSGTRAIWITGDSVELSTQTRLLSGTVQIGASGTTSLFVGDLYIKDPNVVSDRTVSLLIDGGRLVSGTTVVGSSAPVFNENTSAIIGRTSKAGSVELRSGTWDCNGGLQISYGERGGITLEGGSLKSNEATVGLQLGGNALVYGGTWTNSGLLEVRGYSNSWYSGAPYQPSTLEVSGGTVFTGSAYLACGNYNGVTPTGVVTTATISGGTFTTATALTVGPATALNLQGGCVRSGSALLLCGVVNQDWPEAVATVSSGTWDIVGRLDVGSFTQSSETGNRRPAVLGIGGGTVISGTTDIGGANGNGNAFLTSGTLVSRSALLVGTGTFSVLGGYASSDRTFIGRERGSDGKANVLGGSLATAKDAFIGYGGKGTLSVTGGDVSNHNCFVGYLPDGVGAATISGGTWSSRGSLYVGYGSMETATLSASGGFMSASSLIVGHESASQGAVVLSGGTVGVTNAFVGLNGQGSLTMNGGTVKGSSAFLGYDPGSIGVAEVTSGTWTNDAYLHVGFNGTGSLSIRGGTVRSRGGFLGTDYSGNGAVLVTGGTWATTNLTVGGNGLASLAVFGGGVIDVSGTLAAGEYSTISVGPGGTLRAGTGLSAHIDGVKGSFANNGLVVVGGNLPTYGRIAGTVTGTGVFLKVGKGEASVPYSDAYCGSVRIEAGGLKLASRALSEVSVADGGWLGLTGDGQKTIEHLSVIDGGLDIGQATLTVLNGLTDQSLREAIGRWSISSSVADGLGLDSLGWLDHGDGAFTIAVAVPGDTNLDHVVDMLDIAQFLSAGKLNAEVAATWSEGDFNYDGIADILDVSLFLSAGRFNQGPYLSSFESPQVVAVPEPTALVLLCSATTAVAASNLIRRRRA